MLRKYANLIDIYGQPLSFEDHGSPKVHSIGGLISSILSITLISALSFIFGQEIYQRKNPLSTISDQSVKNNTIYLKDFPILFYFRDTYGSLFDPRPYYTYYGYTFHTKGNGEDPEYFDLEVKDCNATDFEKGSEWVQENIDKFAYKPLCIKHSNDTIFSNPYASPNSWFVIIEFLKCDQEIEGDAKKCAQEPELSDALKEVYIQTVFQDTYLEVNDYSTPIKFYDNSVTTYTGTLFLTQNYLSFSVNQFTTDNGWLMESTNTTLYNQFVQNQMTIMSNDGLNTNHIYWLTLEGTRVRKNTNRSYLKVQELLAKIGGLFKGTCLVVDLVLTFYVRFKYTMYVVYSSVLPIDKNDEITRSYVSLFYNKPEANSTLRMLSNLKVADKDKISSNDNISNKDSKIAINEIDKRSAQDKQDNQSKKISNKDNNEKYLSPISANIKTVSSLETWKKSTKNPGTAINPQESNSLKNEFDNDNIPYSGTFNKDKAAINIQIRKFTVENKGSKFPNLELLKSDNENSSNQPDLPHIQNKDISINSSEKSNEENEEKNSKKFRVDYLNSNMNRKKNEEDLQKGNATSNSNNAIKINNFIQDGTNEIKDTKGESTFHQKLQNSNSVMKLTYFNENNMRKLAFDDLESMNSFCNYLTSYICCRSDEKAKYDQVTNYFDNIVSFGKIIRMRSQEV